MAFDESILKNDERAAFLLRSLYNENGYTRFKMSKFEEYELYMHNKDFLVSDGVITFTDTNGKLLALKPDVTLSIVKNSRDVAGQVQKVYYHENVYRTVPGASNFKEIMQTGLECIGDIGNADVFEVVRLAAVSLSLIGTNGMLSLSHVGMLTALLNDSNLNENQKKNAMVAIKQKNAGLLAETGADEALAVLTDGAASAEKCFTTLSAVAKSNEARKYLEELKSIYSQLSSSEFKGKVSLDFSIANDTGYYSGIVFKGYINGIESPVVSGGRYDRLMEKMGRHSGAIGFAVYLDTLERLGEKISGADDGYINVALPKGRLGEKVYNMFELAGYECPSIKETNRKLIFENEKTGMRFFWVKPSDVSIYVERGAADIGVAGKDILLEYEPDVYELLDLDIGKCRMAVAAKKSFADDTSKTLRVATKFSNIARKWYAQQCRDIDIIHLNGSIELAPILGLSDVIVDIVETGKTLVENDLAEVETIVQISARLIANKSSFQFKKDKISRIKTALAEVIK